MYSRPWYRAGWMVKWVYPSRRTRTPNAAITAQVISRYDREIGCRATVRSTERTAYGAASSRDEMNWLLTEPSRVASPPTSGPCTMQGG